MLESMETLATVFALFATIWLALGLALAQLLRKQPARSHGILVAALIGTLITPACFFTVRLANGGLLAPKIQPAAILVGQAANIAPSPRLSSDSTFETTAKTPSGALAEVEPSLVSTVSSRQPLLSNPTHPDRETNPQVKEGSKKAAGWRNVFLWSWLLLCCAMAVRLLIDCYAGYRLVRNSILITSDEPNLHLALLARRMGVVRVPGLSTSDRLLSPVMWGWSSPPLILIPSRHGSVGACQGVYLHELAHLARRDHLWALASDLVLVLLPWHPLAWWAKQALAARSEEACDDWAISCGCDPLDYAGELVDLAPSASGVLTMAAVSKASSLKQRVSRLIRGSFASPRLGRRWVMGLGLIAILLASGFALLQSREARAEVREVISSAPVVESTEALFQPREVRSEVREVIPSAPVVERTEVLAPVPITENRWTHQIRVHAKGKPVPGAKVSIEEYRDENNKLKQNPIGGLLKTNELGIVGVNQYIAPRNGIGISYAEDDAGRFGITNVIPGEGSITHIEITPTRPIRGRVIHEGKALAGVSCQLVSFKRLDLKDNFFQDYPFPLYREALRSRTDEKGEFSFQGIPDGFAGTVLLDQEGLGLAKVSILGGENPTIELAKAGELQVNYPGEGGAAQLSKMYWFMKDLNESTKSSAPLRISYGRLWRSDSIHEGKILRLGPGKYRFSTQHKGTDQFDTGDPVDFEIEPGKTTAITLGAEPLAEISGKVVDEKTGKGIKGINVGFSPVAPKPADFLKWGAVETDATGQFTIYCKGDENYLLGFGQSIPTEEGAVRYYQKHGPFSEKNTVRLTKYQKAIIPDVVMNQSVRLRAAVTDEKGKALTTPFEAFLATKQLTNLDADRPQIRSAKGFWLEQGAVVIPQLDPDNAMAILVRKGKAVNIPEFLVPSGGPRPQSILISDECAVAVRGTVVDSQGMPVKDAQVQLISGRILLEEAKSTAEGKFEFDGLWPGLHYQIAAVVIKDERHDGFINFHTIIGQNQRLDQKLDDLKMVLKIREKR